MAEFTITIKEICTCEVEVEAETREEALAKAEEEYWKAPNDYCLEPRDTFFE